MVAAIVAGLSVCLSVWGLIAAQSAKKTASRTSSEFGTSLDGYDFTTPAASYRSAMEVAANADLRAFMELLLKQEEYQLKEKLQTFEIHKDAEFQGKKLLFVSFKRDGIGQKRVEAMEKNATNGKWFHTPFSRYDLKKESPALHEQVAKWEKNE